MSSVPTIENTLGAVQVGATVAVFLFGIITMQFEEYLHQFSQDTWVIRIMACSLWLLEFLHTLCVSAEAWMGAITFHGRPAAYQRHPWMGGATLIGGFITTTVQCFFCYRSWKALPNPVRYLGAVCGFASLIRCVGAIYLGSRVIVAQTLEEYTAANGWLIRALLGAGMAIDVLIAVAMLYFLLQKRGSGFQSTTRLVDRLLAYTIRTGLLTSVTSITVLVMFESSPHTFIWVGVYVVLAKLYSNSLFSALNERKQLRSIVQQSSNEYGSKGLRHGPHGSRTLDRHVTSAAGPANTINIQMNTTVTCDLDLENDAKHPQKHISSGGYSPRMME